MAKDPVIGAKIVGIRRMMPSELRALYWDDSRGHEIPIAIVLSTGAVLYPSRDDEGNGPGALFGVHKGEQFILTGGR